MSKALSGMKRARSVEEYVRMVEEALDECFDLRASMEWDSDGMAGAINFIEVLEGGLKAMYGQMKDGTYLFATGDLPFMKAVARADERLLAFKPLLARINETHLKGLETDDED